MAEIMVKSGEGEKLSQEQGGDVVDLFFPVPDINNTRVYEVSVEKDEEKDADVSYTSCGRQSPLLEEGGDITNQFMSNGAILSSTPKKKVRKDEGEECEADKRSKAVNGRDEHKQRQNRKGRVLFADAQPPAEKLAKQKRQMSRSFDISNSKVVNHRTKVSGGAIGDGEKRKGTDIRSRVMGMFDLGTNSQSAPDSSLSSGPSRGPKTSGHAHSTSLQELNISGTEEDILKQEVEVYQRQLQSKQDAVKILKQQLISSRNGENIALKAAQEAVATQKRLRETLQQRETLISQLQEAAQQQDLNANNLKAQLLDAHEQSQVVQKGNEGLRAILLEKESEVEEVEKEKLEYRSRVFELEEALTNSLAKEQKLQAQIVGSAEKVNTAEEIIKECAAKEDSFLKKLSIAEEKCEETLKQRNQLHDDYQALSDKLDKAIEHRNFYRSKAESISMDIQKLLKGSQVKHLEEYPRICDENRKQKMQIDVLKDLLSEAERAADAYKAAFQEQLGRNMNTFEYVRKGLRRKKDSTSLAKQLCERLAEKEEAISHQKVSMRMLGIKIKQLEEELEIAKAERQKSDSLAKDMQAKYYSVKPPDDDLSN
eukprot:Nk52_evm47s2039 gene=Nk52_evmTU47s2039